MVLQEIKAKYRILMISFWDFQDEGMQVTQRTPLFFSERGHKVTFMVHSLRYAIEEMTEMKLIAVNLDR